MSSPPPYRSATFRHDPHAARRTGTSNKAGISKHRRGRLPSFRPDRSSACRAGQRRVCPLHHLGKVAPHRPLTNPGNPLANLRCGKRTETGEEVADYILNLRARAVPSGPGNGSASLHARRSVMTVLVPRHAHHDRRYRHERDELIAILQSRVFPRIEPRELVEDPRPAPRQLVTPAETDGTDLCQ